MAENSGLHTLHLEKSASNWEDSTPVGCGFMGMSVFGRANKELIYLNEETVWSGSGNDGLDSGFSEKIGKVRELFLQGKNDEAEALAAKSMKDSFSRIDSYETAGRLVINYGAGGFVKHYSRDIDLLNGVADINYVRNGGAVHVQAFASYPDRVMCYRIESVKQMSFTVNYERKYIKSISCDNGLFTAQCCTAAGEHPFAVAVRICTDGALSCGGGFSVRGATWATLYIGIETAFRSADYFYGCVSRVSHSAGEYKEILARHMSDFSALMKKSELSLSGDSRLDVLPVNERLHRLRNDRAAFDAGLIGLYFDFGKYLLVSSSRPGTMPANLQGVWAEKYQNPWNSNYTININTQMNYWHAEAANLGECHEALFDFLNKVLLPSGKKTAEVNYHARGTVSHHISNIYGFTAPGDGLWGLWPMSSAWFAYHLWEHYLYNGDREFLKNTAYEYIKNCVLFFADYLFEDGEGRLLSGPAASPENSYVFGSERKAVYLGVSPTMDTQIISGLLSSYIEAERLLGIDAELRQKAEDMLSRLVPQRVGKHGQLMEWIEDYEESEPGHRHISHAYGLYPGCSITRTTPELYAAIRKTLERRLENGGGHTGWSRAWLICLFARLRDGESACDNLLQLFRKSTNGNLLDVHPPFQIDGNFGGAAGICEMLLQSHEGFIALLPAVTDSFSGSFSGFMARGGVEVSAEFKKGRLTEFTLVSKSAKRVRVELPDVQKNVQPVSDNKRINVLDGFIELSLNAGKEIKVAFEEANDAI